MSNKIVKPSTLAGFMELLPEEQILFNRMIDIIRKNYEKFGFLPIDTPIIERSEILLAKGGGETEQQIYRFERGDTDLSLRFDLTVPLAKYVAQYFSQLTFPFRRYQIGKVYRGERAQRGRFREFYQCDIDIVGNGKLGIINDAEIPSIIYSTFKDLGFDDFTIKINNRKLLKGFFRNLDIEDMDQVLRTIDKLEKIGLEKVEKELLDQKINQEDIGEILGFIQIEGSNEEKIARLKELNINNPSFVDGLEELEAVNKYISSFGVPKENHAIDLTIARGLDYYTGTVYETFLDDYQDLGSICSGGRYDNLAEHYTKQSLPGVGISIGLTRLFDQLSRANILNIDKESLSKVVIIPMEDCMEKAVEVASSLRQGGINTQIYLEKDRMGKKFAYVDKLDIPYSLVIGPEEVEKNQFSLRNMETGEQNLYSLEELIENLK